MAIKPLIQTSTDFQARCEFGIGIDSIKVKKSDIFANIPAATTELQRELLEHQSRGWVVVKHSMDGHWQLLDVIVGMTIFEDINTTQVNIESVGRYVPCDTIAIGIDQRLKRQDIEGATIIKKNKSGTKWVFAHASEEEHHDRMLLAETAMATLFDELTYNRLSRVLVVIVQGKPKNQQLGELTLMEHIRNFKHDCMRMARWHEGELTIGDHVKDPEEHYIYNMLQKAFATAENKWKREKSAEFNQISDHLTPIKKRLASRHSFKYRWEKPTIFPNAQQSEQGSNEDSTENS